MGDVVDLQEYKEKQKIDANGELLVGDGKGMALEDIMNWFKSQLNNQEQLDFQDEDQLVGMEEYLVNTEEYCGGFQRLYVFPNGVNISVIRHRYSYGWQRGLFEIAVTLPKNVAKDDALFYGDVKGYLTWEEVLNQLKIAETLKVLEFDKIKSSNDSANAAKKEKTKNTIKVLKSV